MSEPLDDVVAVGRGLIYTPICALKSMTVDEAAAERRDRIAKAHDNLR